MLREPNIVTLHIPFKEEQWSVQISDHRLHDEVIVATVRGGAGVVGEALWGVPIVIGSRLGEEGRLQELVDAVARRYLREFAQLTAPFVARNALEPADILREAPANERERLVRELEELILGLAQLRGDLAATDSSILLTDVVLQSVTEWPRASRLLATSLTARQQTILGAFFEGYLALQQMVATADSHDTITAAAVDRHCELLEIDGVRALWSILPASNTGSDTGPVWPVDTPVAIESISVRDLRCFEEIELVLSASEAQQSGQWLLLLGENGRGKTTLLRAIALGLLPRATGRKFLYELSGRAAMLRGGQAQGLVQVSVADVGSIDTEIRNSGSREDLDARTEPSRRPLVLGYGCRRGSATGGADREANPDPLEGCATLFDETVQVLHADTWLRKEHAFRERDPGFYEAIIGTLESILNVERIDVQFDGTWVESAEFGRVRLAALSDGYLTTLGWVVDMVARWTEYARTHGVKLGKGFNRSMSCVVLIDEIDLHLHPAWQTEVVKRLRVAFPMTTFVATTHNPLTLTGLRADEIAVLTLDTARQSVTVARPSTAPGLLTGSELFAHFFGVERRYLEEYRDNLARYAFLARDPYRSDSEEEELHRLGAELLKHNISLDYQPVARETLE